MTLLQLSLKPHQRIPIFGSINARQKHAMSLLPFSTPSTHLSNSLHPDFHHSLMFPPVSKSVAAIVFGDGTDARLYPLTKRRSEGAIPIGANYRLIDTVVSNCINSNINKIYALTQFNSTSLNSHLSRAYSGVGLGKEGFVEVIAAYQSPEDQGWFQGTADAIRRCLWVLEEYSVREFLVLPGHHLYKMDYQEIIESHRNTNADITISALRVAKNQDPGFGFLQIDSENRVLKLKNKVENEHTDRSIFSSMGIYVINRDVIIKLLREKFPKANDFGSEVIPGAISSGMKVKAYLYDGYWEDMRSIEAFYQANMESTKESNIGFNFHDVEYPVYTLPRHLPPTLVTDALITNSIIGDGCILNRCKIKGAVIGFRTKISDGAIVEDSVIMGSDTYETENAQENGLEEKGISVPIGIGEGSHIRKAIIDKNARIGKNVMLLNKDQVQEGNREENGYIISGGIIVVIKNAVILDGTII